MKYRTLGRSGCAVSQYALGTMTFGAETDEKEAFAALDFFFAAGGNLIDTANTYARGGAEQIIGRWLKARAADVADTAVIATKARIPTDNTPNGGGLSARHLDAALDASRRRLGVEIIDLYQAHAFDPCTPLDETLRTLDSFVRAGRIRYYGLCNFTGWEITKAVCRARELGLVPPVTLQTQYSLLSREVEWEITPAAADCGLGILAWSPLAGGWLSGKYRPGEAPQAQTRFAADPKRGLQDFTARAADARTTAVLSALTEIAATRNAQIAQIALAWLPGRMSVSSIILGARNTAQLQSNLEAGAIDLTAAERAALDEASDPAPALYPYGAAALKQRVRKLSGGR